MALHFNYVVEIELKPYTLDRTWIFVTVSWCKARYFLLHSNLETVLSTSRRLFRFQLCHFPHPELRERDYCHPCTRILFTFIPDFYSLAKGYFLGWQYTLEEFCSSQSSNLNVRSTFSRTWSPRTDFDFNSTSPFCKNHDLTSGRQVDMHVRRPEWVRV